MTDISDYQIRNCVFAFRCAMRWEQLEATEEPRVRFCHSCQRQVHFCTTDAQLAEAIQANLCVAIDHPFEDGEERIYPVGLLRSSLHDE